MTKSDILNKYRNDIGYQRNFWEDVILKDEAKEKLRTYLIKDFRLSNEQINFKDESVIIKNDKEIIKLDLFIDVGELRFKEE